MSETLTTEAVELKAVGERLAREVGVLAGRLALFLDSSLPNAGDAIAAGRDFLVESYASVSDGLPLSAWETSATDRRPAGPPHPLDRLADALSLSREEVDLLMLAGMAEQHEGFAAVMRTLHPRGEPRPTVGLAAQFVVEKPGRHLKLRELLECGTATRAGALRLTGDAPFFERSLLPAEALWSALHGLDAWPASVARVGGPVVTCGLAEWISSAETSRAVEAIKRRMKCTVLVTADSEEVAFNRARAIERDLLAVGCDEHCALHTPLDCFDGARSLRARNPLRESARHDRPADPRHRRGPRVQPVQRRPERLSREQRALEERRVACQAQSACARRRAALQKLSEFQMTARLLDDELRGESDGRSRLAARVQRAHHGCEAFVLLGHSGEHEQ